MARICVGVQARTSAQARSNNIFGMACVCVCVRAEGDEEDPDEAGLACACGTEEAGAPEEAGLACACDIEETCAPEEAGFVRGRSLALRSEAGAYANACILLLCLLLCAVCG